MTEFRQSTLKELKEKRPNISDSSLKTYTSNLFNINKKLRGEQELNFFKNHDDILKYISSYFRVSKVPQDNFTLNLNFVNLNKLILKSFTNG